MMKRFAWDAAKNNALKAGRGISFEEVVYHVSQGDVLDILKHPNQRRYAGQQIFVVNVANYAYLVPFTEIDDEIFLKTIIPSRKATRTYLKRKESNSG